MEIEVVSKNALNKLFSIIKENGIILKNNNFFIFSDKKEMDIFISYLARYFFTNTLYKFNKKNNLTPPAMNYMKKDFTGLLYIRKKIIHYLRSGNSIINIEDFIKFNLTDIENIYNDLLIKLNSDSIKNEINKMFGKQQEQKNKLEIAFMYNFEIDKFYFIVKEQKNKVLAEFNNDNYKSFIKFIKQIQCKNIFITGPINYNVLNMIYTDLLLNDLYEINFILPKGGK